MKPNILLINNNFRENEIIEEVLYDVIGVYSLNKAENGKSAFNILMGGSQEKPSIILLNHDLLDMSAIDFLKVMKNYYTLNHIKIFLITEPISDQLQDSFNELGITNFIYRPVLDNRNAFETIKFSLNSSPAFMGIISINQVKTKCFAGFHKFAGKFLSQKAISGNVYALSTKLGLLAVTLLLVSGVAQTIKQENAKKIVDFSSVEKCTAPPLIEESKMQAVNEAKNDQKNGSIQKPLVHKSLKKEPIRAHVYTDSVVVTKSIRELKIKIIEEPDSLTH